MKLVNKKTGDVASFAGDIRPELYVGAVWQEFTGTDAEFNEMSQKVLDKRFDETFGGRPDPVSYDDVAKAKSDFVDAVSAGKLTVEILDRLLGVW
jgi:hypothetical protein